MRETDENEDQRAGLHRQTRRSTNSAGHDWAMPIPAPDSAPIPLGADRMINQIQVIDINKSVANSNINMVMGAQSSNDQHIAYLAEVPVADATEFEWTSASCSDVGLVRQINEDACLEQPERGLWVVADGMGGHTLGDFASRLVIESLNQLPPPASLAQFVSAARERLQNVNRQLRIEAALRNAHIIGSTVVVLLACGRSCASLWAGDSRIYLYRNGQLRPLTRDHSQVEELKASGTLSDEEAILYPARNLITRAVGAADTLDLDEEILDVKDDDMFLLCSDGLSNEVSEAEMCTALVSGNCRQAAAALLELALKRGGRDNISVVVVRADDLYSVEKTVLNPAL
jgi:protein phosphatase